MAEAELRSSVAAILGEFMLEFGALERDLIIALDFVSGASPGESNSSDRLKMHERTERYAKRLADWPGTKAGFHADLKVIIEKINLSREVRNRFAHGRWGISRDSVALVTIGPDGPTDDRFTLDQFRAQLEELRATSTLLRAFRKKWSDLGV